MFNRSWIELHAYQRCMNQVCSISCEVQSRVFLFGFIHGKQQLWGRCKTCPFHKADHCKILSGNLRRLRKITMLKRYFIYKWTICHFEVLNFQSVNMIWEERSPCSSPFLPAWKLQKCHTSCGAIPYFWINNIPHLTLSQEPTSNIHQFLKVIEDGLPLLAQSISIPVFISRCIAHSLHLLLGFHWTKYGCHLMPIDVTWC